MNTLVDKNSVLERVLSENSYADFVEARSGGDTHENKASEILKNSQPITREDVMAEVQNHGDTVEAEKPEPNLVQMIAEYKSLQVKSKEAEDALAAAKGEREDYYSSENSLGNTLLTDHRRERDYIAKEAEVGELLQKMIVMKKEFIKQLDELKNETEKAAVYKKVEEEFGKEFGNEPDELGLSHEVLNRRTQEIYMANLKAKEKAAEEAKAKTPEPVSSEPTTDAESSVRDIEAPTTPANPAVPENKTTESAGEKEPEAENNIQTAFTDMAVFDSKGAVVSQSTTETPKEDLIVAEPQISLADDKNQLDRKLEPKQVDGLSSLTHAPVPDEVNGTVATSEPAAIPNIPQPEVKSPQESAPDITLASEIPLSPKIEEKAETPQIEITPPVTPTVESQAEAVQIQPKMVEVAQPEAKIEQAPQPEAAPAQPIVQNLVQEEKPKRGLLGWLRRGGSAAPKQPKPEPAPVAALPQDRHTRIKNINKVSPGELTTAHFADPAAEEEKAGSE